MTTRKELKEFTKNLIEMSDISEEEKQTAFEKIDESPIVEVMSFLNDIFSKEDSLNESVEEKEKDIKKSFFKNKELQESITNYEFTKFLHEDMGIVFLDEISYSSGHDWSKVIAPRKVWPGVTAVAKHKTLKSSLGKVSLKTQKNYLTGKSAAQITGNLTKSGKAVAAGTLAIMATAFAAKIYKRYATEVGKKCGKLKGDVYDKCANIIKKQGIQKSIDIMTKLKTKCNVTKDPEKCKKAVDEKIVSYKNKMAKLS